MWQPGSKIAGQPTPGINCRLQQTTCLHRCSFLCFSYFLLSSIIKYPVSYVAIKATLLCCEDKILQKFYTLFLIRCRTYEITSPSQTKWPVKTTLRGWCLESSFVHDLNLQLRGDKRQKFLKAHNQKMIKRLGPQICTMSPIQNDCYCLSKLHNYLQASVELCWYSKQCQKSSIYCIWIANLD